MCLLCLSDSKGAIPDDKKDKRIRVSVDVEGFGKFIGAGKNSRLARMNAAKKALKEIKKLNWTEWNKPHNKNY